MKENKEQTPITAHEFYNSNTNLTGYELMEQYAKVKVLEALERVREKLTKKTYTDSFVSLNAFEVIDEEIKKQK